MGAKPPVNWAIQNLDTGEKFIPPFPISSASGIQWQLGGTWAEQARFGFQSPLLAWTNGVVDTFTFEMMLFATHEGIDIDIPLKQFVALGQKDRRLGRPPICLFVFGSVIGETVVFAPMAPIIKSTLDNGKSREATISVTLKKYVAFSQTRLDPTRPQKESAFLVASSNEASYEAIALKHYGNPLFGDRLRKRHPDMGLAPVIGEIIKVPSRTVILSEVVTPAGHMFDATDQNASDAFETILAARNSLELRIIL